MLPLLTAAASSEFFGRQCHPKALIFRHKQALRNMDYNR